MCVCISVCLCMCINKYAYGHSDTIQKVQQSLSCAFANVDLTMSDVRLFLVWYKNIGYSVHAGRN